MIFYALSFLAQRCLISVGQEKKSYRLVQFTITKDWIVKSDSYKPEAPYLVSHFTNNFKTTGKGPGEAARGSEPSVSPSGCFLGILDLV